MVSGAYGVWSEEWGSFGVVTFGWLSVVDVPIFGTFLGFAHLWRAQLPGEMVGLGLLHCNGWYGLLVEVEIQLPFACGPLMKAVDLVVY